jgi:hypothetical protein
MKTPTKVPVTERSVIQRINRRLSAKRERLCSLRPNARGISDLGRYYVLDVYRNAVVTTHINLEAFARELGALSGHEKLEEQ